jgi:hypothetical protein
MNICALGPYSRTLIILLNNRIQYQLRRPRSVVVFRRLHTALRPNLTEWARKVPVIQIEASVVVNFVDAEREIHVLDVLGRARVVGALDAVWPGGEQDVDEGVGVGFYIIIIRTRTNSD